METKLEPCPFCGRPGEQCGRQDEFVTCDYCQDADNGPCVEVARWNTRPIESALRQEIARLEAERDAAGKRVLDVVKGVLDSTLAGMHWDCSNYNSRDIEGCADADRSLVSSVMASISRAAAAGEDA